MRVLVVGAGIMGLSAAWALVKRGHCVTLLEQSDAIPNPLSASGDQHRIIRRAYGNLDCYANMMTEAFDAWQEMWRDFGCSYYADCGGLAISRQPGDGAELLRLGLDRLGQAYHLFTPGEAARTYAFLDPHAFRYAILCQHAGVLLCRSIAAHLARWLVAHGATVRTGACVTALDERNCRVTIAANETIVADRVVLTLGAWTLRLLPHLSRVLQIFRTAVVYLEPPAELRQAWRQAPVILDLGGMVDGYVLPPVADTGLKAGFGVHKRPARDADEDRAAQPGEGARLRSLLAPTLARVEEYKILDVASCAYTFTEDHRFFACQSGPAIIVSACSGHGYKFGAAVGRRIAAAVEEGNATRLAAWLAAESDVMAPARC
jgi:sarcosine oxidase